MVDPGIAETTISDPLGVTLAGICASLDGDHREPEYADEHILVLHNTGDAPVMLLYENVNSSASCRIERSVKLPLADIPRHSRGGLMYFARGAVDARRDLVRSGGRAMSRVIAPCSVADGLAFHGCGYDAYGIAATPDPEKVKGAIVGDLIVWRFRGPIVLRHEWTGTRPRDRFFISSGEDLHIAAGEFADLERWIEIERWRVTVGVELPEENGATITMRRTSDGLRIDALPTSATLTSSGAGIVINGTSDGTGSGWTFSASGVAPLVIANSAPVALPNRFVLPEQPEVVIDPSGVYAVLEDRYLISIEHYVGKLARTELLRAPSLDDISTRQLVLARDLARRQLVLCAMYLKAIVPAASLAEVQRFIDNKLLR